VVVVLDDLLKRNIAGYVSADSQIAGRVEIREGAEVTASVIRGPMSMFLMNSLCPGTSVTA